MLSTGSRPHNEKICRSANPQQYIQRPGGSKPGVTGDFSRQVAVPSEHYGRQLAVPVIGRTSGIPARKFCSTVSSMSYLPGTSE